MNPHLQRQEQRDDWSTTALQPRWPLRQLVSGSEQPVGAIRTELLHHELPSFKAKETISHRLAVTDLDELPQRGVEFAYARKRPLLPVQFSLERIHAGSDDSLRIGT